MHWIDPIADARWAQLVERHPRASVFHTTFWLDALRRTYRYQPIALTSSPTGVELNDGIAFCQVKSWISGSRLVSLPFSDHCHPLLECGKGLGAFTAWLTEDRGRSGWEYVEIRPAGHTDFHTEDAALLPQQDGQGKGSMAVRSNDCGYGFERYQQYSLHKIDLRADLNTLFSNFHKSCIQRKIQQAERGGLEYEAGRSEAHVKQFYRLLLLTRRRHGLPPQPMTWFRNLKDCFGEGLTIHLASKNSRPIAAILTLEHRATVVYKYGCSDAAFHSLGAMPMLFWKAIQAGKQHGAQELDLGRTDLDNQGLTAFKRHLGASGSELTYFRLGRDRNHTSTTSAPRRIARSVFARMPERLAQIAGAVLYRHMG
jgi:Acetyltransferase (GNAT) domain